MASWAQKKKKKWNNIVPSTSRSCLCIPVALSSLPTCHHTFQLPQTLSRSVNRLCFLNCSYLLCILCLAGFALRLPSSAISLAHLCFYLKTQFRHHCSRKSSWLCTISILHPVLISGTAFIVQSYIFTCINSTTYKQKQTYFSCSMAPKWKPNSSSGA